MSQLRIYLLVVGLLGGLGARNVAAQAAPALPAVPGEVALVKLAMPVYSVLARSARVMGEVVVEVQVRSDGTVEAARLVTEHPVA